jgi:pimeloyl-ACP methyl ester carboxylesterase
LATLTLDQGMDIHYELIDGEPGKPYLVFLHEGLGSTAMWKGFPRRLCAACNCPGLVYDRRGYGKSSPLGERRTVHYMHHAALAELPEVLSRLIAGHDYFVIGHSDGGSIGLIHAAEKPARLRGLIAEAGHVFVEERTVAGIAAATAAFKDGRLRALASYHDETDDMFRAWSDVWLSDGFKHWNIEYLLPSIECPVLVVQGTEDQYGTVAQVDSIAARAPDVRTVMLPACGHSPHHEQPERVLSAMLEFLQRHI